MKHKIIEIARFGRKIVANWWASRTKAWKIFLGIGAFVPVINGGVQLYDRFSANPEEHKLIENSEPGPKLEPPKLQLTTVITNHDEFAIVNGEDAGFLLNKMAKAYNEERDYEGSRRYADILLKLFDSLDKDDHRFDQAKMSVWSVMMEEAFYEKNYQKVIDYYNSMCSVMADKKYSVRPMNVAMFDIAKLRLDGKKMFFFSPCQLGELRGWDKSVLLEYMRYVANWGYVQPLMIDQLAKTIRPFFYEDYFDFDQALPYKPCFMVVSTNSVGEEVVSNEMTAQWVGRDRFESVDINRCVDEILGLRDEEIVKRPIRLKHEFTKDGNGSLSWGFASDARIPTNAVCIVKSRCAWRKGINKGVLRFGTRTDGAFRLVVSA